MSKRPLVRYRTGQRWSNWHATKGVGGTPASLCTPHNVWRDSSSPSSKEFRPGLLGLMEIVAEARAKDKRVRALGSGWSLSQVAYTEDFLVNTARLTDAFPLTAPSMLKPGLVHDDLLVFAQCGVQIKTLNRVLEGRRMCLKTAGASNGQTIAGALSTGTHGGATQVGSISEYVVGLHIVDQDGEHYWIERKSDPKVSDKFCTDHLGGAVLKRADDDLFNAALVSFGSFGLIHAVLLEASPIFLLEKWVGQRDYGDVEGALATLDVSDLDLPRGAELPYHFEVVINPYRRKVRDKGAFIRVYYKRDLAADEPVPVLTIEQGALIQSEDLVNVIATVSDAVPDLIPKALQAALERSVKPTDDQLLAGTPGQHFGDSTPSGGGTSLEIGVPLEKILDALKAIFSVTDQFPFAAPAALRYVAPSGATLGFTCHEPQTCTIEMPGIDSDRSREGHERIFTALRDSEVPHTYHWGQSLPLNPHWVRKGFGDDRVEAWIEQRRKFLDPVGRHMFSNRMVDRLGLSS